MSGDDAGFVPAQSEERVALREQLCGIFDALSDQERYVLVASKLDGVGYPDLAQRLGKSVAAVKQMVSRATRRLRAATAPAPAPIGGVGR